MQLRSITRVLACLLTTGAAGQSAAFAQSINLDDFPDVAAHHPAADAMRRLFPMPAAPVPVDFKPTGLTKKDYLTLIADNVDFWKQHQNAAGAIIDPYEKRERQYSTPAFALAAARLVASDGRNDLLDPASRAFGFSLAALVNKTTADKHADFYIPMLMHAHRLLGPRASPELAANWKQQLQSLIPENNYTDTKPVGNWNLVNVAGEAMRRQDGLVATTQATMQQSYLDTMIDKQLVTFSRQGMYQDANMPLAYDAFPRLWLEDMRAGDAYVGAHGQKLAETLAIGSLSSLLLTSPSGEWVSGGRSAHHQWNEAQNAVISEINAARWLKRGRPDVAGAFKRAARLGLASMKRWQRPGENGRGGEMWIVKNFADPQKRFGFEGYGFNSQYNLLPMAMLAIAYERADDTITERPVPSEYGTYVFDLRDPFTQVVAAGGGYFVQINTNADSHYNATGLQRAHRRGVELSPLSDSAAADRGYGNGAMQEPRAALAPGLQWRDGEEWIGLADFHRFDPPPKPKDSAKPAEAKPQRVVKGVDLQVDPSTDRAIFSLKYDLDGPGARDVEERYNLSSNGVECTQTVGKTKAPSSQPASQQSGQPSGQQTGRFIFPVLVNDGARDTEVQVADNTLVVARIGGLMIVRFLNPPARFSLAGPLIPTHNGYVKTAFTTEVGDKIRWMVTLDPAPMSPPPAK